jgi:pyruvate-formate lyase-activating enzyme
MEASSQFPHALDAVAAASRSGPAGALPALAEPWARSSLIVTFAFHCNLACEFCMVEDVLNVIDGTSLDAFQKAVSDPTRLGGKTRLVFSGGEVTLAKNLHEYAAAARAVPGIEHVRIQTNAVRLGDRDYLRSLIDAGIDEFFVSIHAPDAALCDELTQRDQSFDGIVAGMENIVAEGATLVTNTAIVSKNYKRLAEVVDLVARFSPRAMEFWNYWPRSDEDCARDQAAPVAAIRPHLLDAVTRAESHGVPPVIRWFPRCLLGPFARYADDYQPGVLIPDWFWDRQPRYGCLYEGVCADGGDPCSGLSHAYIRRYGWEEKLLTPRRPTTSRGATDAMSTTGATVSKPRRLHGPDEAARDERVAAWLDAYGVALGTQMGQFKLRSVEPSPREAMVVARLERGDESFEIRIHPLDPESPAFIRTAGLNISYGKSAPGRSEMAQAAARALAAAFRLQDGRSALFPAD